MNNLIKNIESTWSIVVTAKTTIENINIFIKHHLEIGVDNIYIFLDSPQDFQENDSFFPSDKVKIFKCDDIFWRQRKHYECLRYPQGERPDIVEYRQYHNMLHAHSICNSEWLLMIDIDELLYCKGSVSEILKKYPENIFSILVKPVEAIYHKNPPVNFDEVFCTKYFKIYDKNNVRKWNEIYNISEIKHKSGFYGHITGKTFFRTKYPIKVPSCHVSKPYENDLGVAYIEDNLFLMHFEAQTPEYFANKIKNRANKTFNIGFLDTPSVQRIKNIINNYNNNGESYLSEIYGYMHVFDDKRLSKCIDAGLVLAIENKYMQESLKHKRIQTYHGEFFVLDRKKLKVIAIRECDYNSSEHCYIHIIFNLTREDLRKSAFLYTIFDNQIKYLTLNRDGFLILYSKAKAQLLNAATQGELFSLQSEDKFLSARKDGSVQLIAELKRDWELFSLSDFNY